MEDSECIKMVLTSFLPCRLSDSDMARLVRYVELVKRNAYLDGYADGVSDTCQRSREA